MSTPLTIELFNESTTLDLQVNELTIKSAINELFEVSLSCGVPVSDDLLAKLDNYADFILSINGDFGNPKFELELQSYDINYQPNTDIQILELKLTDRYAKFRKLDYKGAFYYHNLNDIWLKFYDGFKDRLNRKISDNILFDSNNTDKYPTHPIYVQYNETHWNFLTRTLLEHGVNYNFVASQDGFNFVMYNTNEDITKFIQSDKSNSIDELYSYNLKLDANIKNKDDTVLAYNIIPAKSGYVANKDIKDFCNYHNKEKQRLTLRPKKFIKNINFIHHNPYTPESFLISKATLDSKFPITQDFKSRFNTLTQSQLDECLDTQKNVLSSLDAEQLICNISKVFLLAGAKLDISGNNKLESREHIVTSSLVKLSASTSTDKVIGATPKKNYNVITTLISQDIHIDYHQEAPEQPQISSLVGVFPYLAESSTNHDVVDPDDIGNVRVKLPLDYEVCPNNEKDIRYYVPRISDYGDTNSSHSVQLYRESELLLMFIDGNPNKPIIYGALSHGQTSDQSMKDHHNRHVKEWGQGSGFGYSSDAKGTNDIFIKSQHNDGIAWVAQSNHGSKNELSLDQLFASTSNRSDSAIGEYQHFYGYDDNTNFAANHHKSIKPKTAVEDMLKTKQETLQNKK
ncbi:MULTISPECIES: contractile injection system protein, VgrG/Pvc8 family [Francisella]|uniref:contractile injection system protein, VgrG/Pvc8 family n=1 Tax=Francisella TaxID=262 RepID=UPI0011B42509|nr:MULTISPECIES: contractile injection system protein, VgrG/Pvc8 family [Francisella]